MSFINLDEVKEKEIAPGFSARMVHSEHMTVAFWTIKAGSVLREHSHPHEQVTHMIEGQFELTVDKEAKVLAPGIVAVIPSTVPHSGRAITDCKIIDVFHPVREEYR